MNKKVLLLLLLLLPFTVSGKCDYDKHDEYVKLAPNITYDNNYSKSEGKFTIIIYNIFEGMYVKNGSKKIMPDEESKVTISGISQGKNISLKIYADDGCEEVKLITVMEPYYNEFYESNICFGYEDKIGVCSSQFTTSIVTRSLVEKAKENYDKAIPQIKPKQKDNTDNSLLGRIKAFIEEWGIKILLVVVTLFITITIYSTKFRKIKHGI